MKIPKEQCLVCRRKYVTGKLHRVHNIALKRYVYYCKRCSKINIINGNSQRKGNIK